MYLFLDTETTGVTPMDRIVSICWSRYDSRARHITTTNHVVRPDGFTIPNGASAIHGITTRDALRDGIPLEDALGELYSEIEQHGPTLYVGHNVSFDRPIVLNEYGRVRHRENFSSLPTYCTMKSTTEICCIPQRNRSGYKWPKLAELHSHLFGSPHDDAHDAEADVRATAKCFFELQRRGFVAAGKSAAGPTPSAAAPAPRISVIQCPGCRGQLRVTYFGTRLSLRCPSCTHQFSFPL